MGENEEQKQPEPWWSEVQSFKSVLWGADVKSDVFRRWAQGFNFSEDEPSALIQFQGGPCAVICPVQAYLLKALLMDTPGHSFKDLTTEKCQTLLIQAISNILKKCKNELQYRLVTVGRSGGAEQGVEAIGGAAGGVGDEQPEDMVTETSQDGEDPHVTMGHEENRLDQWSPDDYHERLTVFTFDTIDDVEKFYSDNFQALGGDYGVLNFLYTVLLTKGLSQILNELSSDTSEPLIHSIYGYGSQALINLMLTGQAVAHVWDYEQDVGGLKLKGLEQQSDIGFITLMEQLRYCTVGSFYKNPRNPVWVMGTDCHLTVLFSNEKRLVSPETPSEHANRVFRQFDTEGSNFIASVMLQDVLCALNLVSDPEYVDIMRKKLDPENLGIILMNAFMYEFFPEDKKSTPDTFDLMHYNGIPNSNVGNKVTYSQGTAILLESDLKQVCISNPMLTCLQTKWPNIEVNWIGDRPPSLN